MMISLLAISLLTQSPDGGLIQLDGEVALDVPTPNVMTVKQGDLAPADGIWVKGDAAIELSNQIQECDDLKALLLIPEKTEIQSIPKSPFIVGGIVLGVLVGFFAAGGF